MRCLFPEALKPWQKVLCCGTGVLTPIGLGYGLFKAGPDLTPSFKYLTSKTPSPMRPDRRRGRSCSPKEPWGPGMTCGFKTVVGLGSLAITFPLAQGGWKATKEDWRLFRGLWSQQECCLLMRRSAYLFFATPAITTGLVLSVCAFPIVGLLSLDSARDDFAKWAALDD